MGIDFIAGVQAIDWRKDASNKGGDAGHPQGYQESLSTYFRQEEAGVNCGLGRRARQAPAVAAIHALCDAHAEA